MFNMILLEDDESDLFWLNEILQKASCDRFNFITHYNKYCLYDYDESSKVKDRNEIIDIIDCQRLTEFVYNEHDQNRLTKVLQDVIGNLTNVKDSKR